MAGVVMSSEGFRRLDEHVIAWFRRHSLSALRIAIGAVFLWFGALKFIPGASPAEDLALRTIDRLTAGAVPGEVALALLATWECVIGLGVVAGRWPRAVLALLWAQIAGIFLPLVFFPGETFSEPFVPTLEGQYIIKNVVIVAATMVLGGSVGNHASRGHRSGTAISRGSTPHPGN